MATTIARTSPVIEPSQVTDFVRNALGGGTGTKQLESKTVISVDGDTHKDDDGPLTYEVFVERPNSSAVAREDGAEYGTQIYVITKRAFSRDQAMLTLNPNKSGWRFQYSDPEQKPDSSEVEQFFSADFDLAGLGFRLPVPGGGVGREIFADPEGTKPATHYRACFEALSDLLEQEQGK